MTTTWKIKALPDDTWQVTFSYRFKTHTCLVDSQEKASWIVGRLIHITKPSYKDGTPTGAFKGAIGPGRRTSLFCYVG